MPNWARAANWTALAIGAGLILASVECALAADLPPAPSLPQAGPSSEDFSGWYLRGDLGAGFEPAPALNAAADPIASIVPGGVLSPYGTGSFRNSTLSPSGTIDAGVGYVLNPWLRMDGTLEYRFGAELRSSLAIVDPAPLGGGGTLFRRRRASRRRLLDRRAPQRLRRSRQLLGRHALPRGRRRRRGQCAVGRIRPGARHLGRRPGDPGRRGLLQCVEDELRLGADGRARLRHRPKPQDRGELPLSRSRLARAGRPSLRGWMRRRRRSVVAWRPGFERHPDRPHLASRAAPARRGADRRAGLIRRPRFTFA